MKRWQIGLLGCTLLILFSGGALAQPTDIPPNHWAYKAVQTLVQRGYMDVEPDGTFGGDKSVSRYDLAASLAQLLSDVEEGRVQISAGTDVDLLRELEREFRAELVQWYAERDRIEAAYGHTQRQVAVIDEQLNLLLNSLDEEAMRTDALFESTNERISDLQELVLTAFGEYGESVADRLDEQIAFMATLREDVDDLIAAVAEDVFIVLEQLALHVDDIDRRLNRVNDQAAALAMRLSELESEDRELRREVLRLQDVLGTSEEQIARMTERVRTQLDDQLALSLSRERQLERQLQEVRTELDGYKARAAEEVRAARNMGTTAIGVAAVAVLLSLMN